MYYNEPFVGTRIAVFSAIEIRSLNKQRNRHGAVTLTDKRSKFFHDRMSAISTSFSVSYLELQLLLHRKHCFSAMKTNHVVLVHKRYVISPLVATAVDLLKYNNLLHVSTFTLVVG